MIPQYQALAFRPQRSRQTRTLFLAEHHATKHWVHCLRIAIEVCDVLVDHLQLARKRAPCLASFAVTVTCRRYVWPSLVHCRVYEEARCVGWSRGVSADDLAVVVDEDHV